MERRKKSGKNMHKTGLCVDSNSANRTILKRIKVIPFWSSWYYSYHRYAHCARENKRKFAFESCMAVCVCVFAFFLRSFPFFNSMLLAPSKPSQRIEAHKSIIIKVHVRYVFAHCFSASLIITERANRGVHCHGKKNCYEWNIRIIWAIRACRFISHAAHSRNCAGAIIAMWIELLFLCVCVCVCFIQVYDINEH